MRHVTYFVLAPKAGMVKIGQTTEDIESRVTALQTGCPERLSVELMLDHKPPFEESQLHWRFRNYRSHGEWFEYRDELCKFMKTKKLNPSPTSEDDLVLAGEKGKRSFKYPKHDSRQEHNVEGAIGYTDDNIRLGNKPFRSVAYGLAPVFGSRSTSQEFWHQVSVRLGPHGL